MSLSLNLLLICACFCICVAVHESMNFVLPPLQRECFFEDFDSTSPPKTVEAFVQSGGNLDVLLAIHGPLVLDDIRIGAFEKPVVKERLDAAKESKSETQTIVVEFKPELSGTYGICLDNRASRFSSKIVQLDVRTSARIEPIILNMHADQEKERDVDEGVVKAKEALNRIQKGINRIMLQQQRDRHRLALHSETNIMSHHKVVTGSILETAVFIAAAVFQILFVRRWFVGRNTNTKQWA